MIQNLVKDLETISVILTLYTTELQKYFLNSTLRNISLISKIEQKMTDISNLKYLKTEPN